MNQDLLIIIGAAALASALLIVGFMWEAPPLTATAQGPATQGRPWGRGAPASACHRVVPAAATASRAHHRRPRCDRRLDRDVRRPSPLRLGYDAALAAIDAAHGLPRRGRGREPDRRRDRSRRAATDADGRGGVACRDGRPGRRRGGWRHHPRARPTTPPARLLRRRRHGRRRPAHRGRGLAEELPGWCPGRDRDARPVGRGGGRRLAVAIRHPDAGSDGFADARGFARGDAVRGADPDAVPDTGADADAEADRAADPAADPTPDGRPDHPGPDPEAARRSRPRSPRRSRPRSRPRRRRSSSFTWSNVDLVVSFNGSDSLGESSYSWNFGDGSGSSVVLAQPHIRRTRDLPGDASPSRVRADPTHSNEP